MADPEVDLVSSLTAPQDATVAFYDSNADDYDRATRSNDLSALYPLLLNRLPSGGLVLDAGCGSGRDILAFLQRGFRVEAFDASAQLADLATKLTGVHVEVQRFENWPSPLARYDGIWCFASLLHVARQDLPQALRKLSRALKPGGWLFASFKRGASDTIDRRGRRYTNLTVTSARRLFGAETGFEGVRVWQNSGPSGLGDVTTWIYVLAGRAR
uniref:class I SAM-dependent methyltransferase n=1 Tax=Altererythrobacter segetis TaxID=1104773 RepID=UPI00140B443A